MSQNRPAAFSSLRMGGKTQSKNLLHPAASANTASPEVIREKVQDGVTGETRDMQYTQCKIVGNGSFGVVFQTKLSPSGEDAAIKRVLQDKRFKVRIRMASVDGPLLIVLRIVNCRSCALSVTQISSSSRLSTTRMASGYATPNCFGDLI
jgi:serine/threonine protein kinase